MRVLPGKPLELVQRSDELRNGQVFTGIIKDYDPGVVHTFYALRDESRREVQIICLDHDKSLGAYLDIESVTIELYQPFVGIMRVTPEPDGSPQ